MYPTTASEAAKSRNDADQPQHDQACSKSSPPCFLQTRQLFPKRHPILQQENRVSSAQSVPTVVRHTSILRDLSHLPGPASSIGDTRRPPSTIAQTRWQNPEWWIDPYSNTGRTGYKCHRVKPTGEHARCGPSWKNLHAASSTEQTPLNPKPLYPLTQRRLLVAGEANCR